MNFARLVANMPVNETKKLDAFQRYSTFLKPKSPDFGPVKLRSLTYDMRHNTKDFFKNGYKMKNQYGPRGTSDVYTRDAQGSYSYQNKVTLERNRFEQMRAMGRKSYAEVRAEEQLADLNKMDNVIPLRKEMPATNIGFKRSSDNMDSTAPIDMQAELDKSLPKINTEYIPNPKRAEMGIPFYPSDFENAAEYNAAVANYQRSKLPSPPDFDRLNQIRKRAG